jgi:hypothetical protein
MMAIVGNSHNSKHFENNPVVSDLQNKENIDNTVSTDRREGLLRGGGKMMGSNVMCEHTRLE